MKDDRLLVGFAGDVMIGRGVDHIITRKGYKYPWGNLLPLLTSADINIINLETTLTTSQKQVAKVFNFKAAPDRIISLTEARVTIASLANNHILDFSEEGLLETILLLDAAEIHHVGAGTNVNAATQPAIVTKNNISVGIVGLTDNEPGWAAGLTNSGINYINVLLATDRER